MVGMVWLGGRRTGTVARILPGWLLLVGCLRVAPAAAAPAGPPAAGWQLYSSLEEDLRDVTKAYLKSCRDTLRIAMYKLSDRATLRRLAKALRGGLSVRLLVDGGALLEEQVVPWASLPTEGLQVRVWPAGSSELHAKFAVNPAAGVLMGSANWTPSGMKRNVEVLLWSREPELIRRMVQVFETLWSTARPVTLGEKG